MTLPATAPKTYLGDSVYAVIEDGSLVLTTWNGLSVSNRIVLEPEVYAALLKYVASFSTQSTEVSE